MAIRTFKKLVEIEDGYGGGGLEIDMVKLRRVAKAFKAWLLTLDPSNDPFGFRARNLLIVDSALNETLELPFKDSRPAAWEMSEGLLPAEYSEKSAVFYNGGFKYEVRGG